MGIFLVEVFWGVSVITFLLRVLDLTVDIAQGVAGSLFRS